MNPKKVVDFPVYSTFYLLLGCNGDFQTSFMQNQKPHHHFLDVSKNNNTDTEELDHKVGVRYYQIHNDHLYQCGHPQINNDISEGEELIICQDYFKDDNLYTNTF